MIYLASQSPRRAQLLQQIDIKFQIITTDNEEDPPYQENATQYVSRIACQKSKSGWKMLKKKNLPPYPLLSADTIVTIDDRILGKPKDNKEAQMMLTALSGKTHRVITAVSVIDEKKTDYLLVETFVTMDNLHPKVIDAYIRTKEPFDKAGAYGIQGKGTLFIKKISGSYTNIVGLPLRETTNLLYSFGVNPWLNTQISNKNLFT